MPKLTKKEKNHLKFLDIKEKEYVDLWSRKDKACLDGWFTSDELRIIAKEMENNATSK